MTQVPTTSADHVSADSEVPMEVGAAGVIYLTHPTVFDKIIHQDGHWSSIGTIVETDAIKKTAPIDAGPNPFYQDHSYFQVKTRPV